LNCQYVGSELALFAAARNWKSYLASQIEPHIGSRVLEVGAGLGSNIPYLCHRSVERWTALEPDPALARRIRDRISAAELPDRCEVIIGTLASVSPAELFDTVLYIDVLEHIADDAAELVAAAQHLVPAGHLIVVVPAHQYLFSPFDTAIGHHRRYEARRLADITPQSCRLIGCWLLDSVGLLASLGNRLFLRSATPSAHQIAVWDKILVPMSRTVDRLTGYRFGKTIMAVWARNG
jgi:SAM-dependent methyltransferase